MFNKIILTIISGLALLLTSSVFAFTVIQGLPTPKSNWYAQINSGINYLQDQSVSNETIGTGETLNYKTGWNFGAGIGRQFNRQWQLGLSVDYMTNRIKSSSNSKSYNSGSINSFFYLLNVNYTIPTKSKLSPYFTTGIGIARTTFKPSIGSDSATPFAYQFGFGLNYAVSKHMQLFTQYRHLATTNQSYYIDNNDVSAGYQNNLVSVGIKVIF